MAAGGGGTAANLNWRKLAAALIPLVLSLLAFGLVYWFAFVKETEPVTLSIAAGEKGSESFAVISALAEVAEQTRSGVRIRLIETTGTNESLTLIARGEADLGAMPADAVFPNGLSLVANLYEETFQLLARPQSGIHGFGDLAGKRVALPLQSSGQFRSFWLLASHYGIPAESFRITTVSGIGLIGELRAGSVDAVFRMGAGRNRGVRQIVDNVAMRFVPIDQGQAIHLRFPALQPAILAKGSYAGSPAMPAVDLPTVAITRFLVSGPETGESSIRELTSILFEKRRDLGQREPLAGQASAPSIAGGTLLPVHAGAAAYYDRERPSFLAENSDLIGVLLSIFAVAGSALLWLKRRFEEGRKGRIDVYNLELARINAAAADAPPEALAALSAELYAMLNRVIGDLDDDKVAAGGFHTFAFTWEAVRRAIADRRAALTKPRTPRRR